MTWVLEQCTDEDWTEPVPVPADRRGGHEQAGEPVPGAVPVRAGAADGGSGAEVRAWVIDAEGGDCRAVWRRWAERFDRTGLWPVISGPVDRLFLSGSSRRTCRRRMPPSCSPARGPGPSW